MTALETFEKLVRAPGTPPLLRGAVLLAQYADDRFDPESVVQTVSDWAAQLRQRIATDTSALNRLRLLNHFFFEELGFRGDTDSYGDAANSFLHRVIERRAGIPISLAVLYLEIGRAVGLKLHGVSFPGHFLVKLLLVEGALFIDVFDGGVTLSADDLRERLRQVMRGQPEYPLDVYLRTATEREILGRMLRNLKAIHAGAEEWPQLLEVLNRLILVTPDAAEERRDRALVYEKLDCPRGAADDLVAYLSMTPDPPDAGEIRGRLAQIQRAAQRLN